MTDPIDRHRRRLAMERDLFEASDADLSEMRPAAQEILERHQRLVRAVYSNNEAPDARDVEALLEAPTFGGARTTTQARGHLDREAERFVVHAFEAVLVLLTERSTGVIWKPSPPPEPDDVAIEVWREQIAAHPEPPIDPAELAAMGEFKEDPAPALFSAECACMLAARMLRLDPAEVHTRLTEALGDDELAIRLRKSTRHRKLALDVIVRAGLAPSTRTLERWIKARAR